MADCIYFTHNPFNQIVEQAAKFLSDKLINAGSPVVGGKITVRTETWNSQDGVTNKSEKTESWGGSHSLYILLQS